MNACGVTFDIDWAPDVAIDHTARLLIEHGVPATWFVTHESPAVDRLRERPDLFELGIHPNFLAGSTHGATPDEVLEHCMALVPDAVSMRMHSLYQSTPLLALVLAATPIEVDASLLLLHARGLQPTTFTWAGKTLVRLPFSWEDDLEMEEEAPSWTLDRAALDEPGVTIFDFHPIHVYLNSSSMTPYRSLCAAHPLQSCTETELRAYVGVEPGTGTFFAQLLDELAQRGGGVRAGDFRAWRRRPAGAVSLVP